MVVAEWLRYGVIIYRSLASKHKQSVPTVQFSNYSTSVICAR